MELNQCFEKELVKSIEDLFSKVIFILKFSENKFTQSELNLINSNIARLKVLRYKTIQATKKTNGYTKEQVRELFIEFKHISWCLIKVLN